MPARALTDLELLRLEIATIWEVDGRGRLLRNGGLGGGPAPYFVAAVAGDGVAPAAGTRLPDASWEALAALVMRSPRGNPRDEPTWLPAARSILEADLGSVTAASGPSYLAEEPREFPMGRAVRTPGDGSLPRPAEKSGWTDDEWRSLMAGELGPWAAAVEAGSVVATCFCSRLTPLAAEAGVWTQPDHRRRGYASAVTAAWVAQVLETGRIAFYSTSRDNLASQGLAARLGLRPIGWMWQLMGSRSEVGPDV
jgi:RimJ/RimL family protein N-acetyltransferase